MFDEPDRETPNTDSKVGLWLSLFAGCGTGYWAYSLDPTGEAGSVLVWPAAVVAGCVSLAFLATGIIARNEPYGWSLIVGGFSTLFLFFLAADVLRTLLGN